MSSTEAGAWIAAVFAISTTVLVILIFIMLFRGNFGQYIMARNSLQTQAIGTNLSTDIT